MTTLTVTGMNCGSCVDRVTNAILELDPAAYCSVDLADKRVETSANASIEDITAAIKAAGYDVGSA